VKQTAVNLKHPFVDFSKNCPHPKCGEPLGDARHFCAHCGGAFGLCANCLAANRLLAVHCRFCAQPMKTAVWPMEPGLIAKAEHATGAGEFATVQHAAPYVAKVIASPIAADGLIVVAYLDGHVVVLSQHNLSPLFRFQIKESIAVTPALKDCVLYLAAGSRLYACDLAAAISDQKWKPNVLWHFDCEGEIVQPVLADDRNVYVVTKNDRQYQVEAFRLAVLDAEPDQPQRVWKPQTVGNSRTTPLMRVNRRLALVSFEGALVTLDANTGQMQSFPNPAGMPHPNVAPCVAGERIIFINADKQVCKLNPESSPPGVAFFEGSRDEIKALAANEKYIALGLSYGLVLLDDRGSRLWENADTDQAITVAPVLTDQNIFALTSSGVVFKFNPVTGAALDKRKLFSGSVLTPPLLTQSMLAAVSAEGEVSVLKLKN